jgi:hypothetical protein
MNNTIISVQTFFECKKVEIEKVRLKSKSPHRYNVLITTEHGKHRIELWSRRQIKVLK